jgi:quinol monooxygenase YgiN
MPSGAKDQTAELFIFARFHARAGAQAAVEEALRDVLGPSRDESGCLSINLFRSPTDPRLFYIHSRWTNEAAFDLHASLPHTERFTDRIAPLIDHELEVKRTTLIG